MNVMERMGMAFVIFCLFGQVLLTNASCMGPCSVGPVVVVYPDGVWYNKVTHEDIDEILDQHIGQGKKVERLEMPEELWG
jgi:(2Fe-2S) ferredoxin